MSCILIQSATGRQQDLLDLTQPIHQQYCDFHGITYLVNRGRFTIPEYKHENREPNWDKIPLLALGITAFDYVIWLDADTLIVDHRIDLYDSMQYDNIEGLRMAVHNSDGFMGWDGWHYNTGVMLFGVPTEELKNMFLTFLENAYKHGPGISQKGFMWQDQAGILREIQNGSYPVNLMTNMLNSTEEVNEAKNPIIKAWHGQDIDSIVEKLKKEIPNVIY